jgi:aspartate/methionine/tyrosine aminotransferase
LNDIKGIKPIKSTAAMYMMVRLRFDQFRPDCGIKDDHDFVLKLWEAESALVLPSKCFFEVGYFRVVTCISLENADEFILRLSRFLKTIVISD